MYEFAKYMGMDMKINRFFAGILTVVLLLGMKPELLLLAAQENREEEELIRSEKDFSEMSYERMEDTEFKSILEKINILCETKENAKEVLELFESLDTILLKVCRNSSLIQIYFYQDSTNEEYKEEELYMTKLRMEFSDQYMMTGKKILNSPCAEAAKEEWEEEAIEAFSEYEELTAEEERLREKETTLEQKYNEAALETDVFLHEGKSYKETELEDLYYSGEITDEQYAEYYSELMKNKNKRLSGYFLDLVSVRTELAKMKGYGSYSDYAYEKVYDRDFMPDDLKKFREQVKEYIVPVYFSLMIQIYSDTENNKIDDLDYSKDTLFSYMETYLPQIREEFTESWDYMIKYNLYDLDAYDTKQQVGFTTQINVENVPFMFNYPNESFYDFKTVVHEFGHYNSMFHASKEEWDGLYSNLDLSEIHSQGMELLFMEYYGEIFGEQSELASARTISDMLNSLIDGCIYDEFQIAVYENPEMTLEEINAEYSRILQEYGVNFLYSGDGTEWVQVPHNFQSPLYYISYATSAAAAFEIWKLDIEDRGNAVSVYMDIVEAGNMGSFQETLEECGLNNPITNPDMKQLAQDVGEYFAEEGTAPSITPSLDEAKEEIKDAVRQELSRLPAVCIILYSVYFVSAGILTVIIRRREKE